MFLSDEGPNARTLDFTIRIGSTPTFLYFDLYLPKPRFQRSFDECSWEKEIEELSSSHLFQPPRSMSYQSWKRGFGKYRRRSRLINLTFGKHYFYFLWNVEHASGFGPVAVTQNSLFHKTSCYFTKPLSCKATFIDRVVVLSWNCPRKFRNRPRRFAKTFEFRNTVITSC